MNQQVQSIPKAFFTIREAATYANCSTMTIRRAVRTGQLAHHRLGRNETKGKIFIRTTDMESFLTGCRLEAKHHA